MTPERYSCQWIVAGQVIGVGWRTARPVHGEWQRPRSAAFVCHQCGELWGRVKVFGAPWTVWEKACPRCAGYGDELPGSLWLAWDKASIEDMPKEVLNRELTLALDRAEKELCNA